MALRNFYNEIKHLKVKEVPGYVKPMLSIDSVKKAISRGMDRYYDKYIDTSSPDPLYHVCFGGMIFWYFVNLPHERRHLEHLEQERLAKQAGGAVHH